jgi:alpha-ketoglutarate-dependent 2,4-dichlorophenoxyacetate dioxygenase
VNPVNGLGALYLASHTFAVDGLPDDEAQHLVDELVRFCTQPGRVYTHAWQSGDVLVWDERATLHRGRPWPYDEERTLASICVSVSDADGVDSVRVGPAE